MTGSIMNKLQSHIWTRISALYGFLGVSAGAFGAHALKNRLSEDLLAIFETGSRYCLVHAIVLFAISVSLQKQPNHWLSRGALCFSVGIFIFSGTLWLLALTDTRWLGAFTPLGGVGLIFGWICIFLSTTGTNDE